MSKVDYENIAKRMIALNSIGGYIDHCDGHRWLCWGVAGHDIDMYRIAQEKKVEILKTKRYGGIVSILDAVDEFLPKVGYKTLLAIYRSLEMSREDSDSLLLEDES